MLKFISGFLLTISAVTGAAQAIDYNQWQLMPAAKRAAAEAGNQAAAKPNHVGKKHKQQAERLRLVNAKDKYQRLVLACSVNSGHMQISAVFGGSGDKEAAGAGGKTDKTGKISAAQTAGQNKAGSRQAKNGKTTLSLMIDGKSVLKDNPAAYRRTKRGNKTVRANLHGDAMVHFISQFLSAKKVIAVASGDGAAESYMAANAAQAGLALQNCLHK